MADLNDSLNRCFKNRSTRAYYGGSSLIVSEHTPMCMMEIPVDGETFEVPVMAFEGLDKWTDTNDNISLFVMSLEYSGKWIGYKSLQAGVTKGIIRTIDGAKLFRLFYTEENGWYYCSFGSIFDKDFQPVVMCTWEIGKVLDKETKKYFFRLLKPILRVAPKVFDKGDKVERYIVNQVIPTSLDLNIPNNNFHIPCDMNDPFRAYKVKVIIDSWPFKMRSPAVPDIETANEGLIRSALDNIDDMRL